MTLDLTPAEYVLIVRRRMNLKQGELASLVGVCCKTIVNLENGLANSSEQTINRIKLLADRQLNGK